MPDGFDSGRPLDMGPAPKNYTPNSPVWAGKNNVAFKPPPESPERVVMPHQPAISAIPQLNPKGANQRVDVAQPNYTDQLSRADGNQRGY